MRNTGFEQWVGSDPLYWQKVNNQYGGNDNLITLEKESVIKQYGDFSLKLSASNTNAGVKQSLAPGENREFSIYPVSGIGAVHFAKQNNTSAHFSDASLIQPHFNLGSPYYLSTILTDTTRVWLDNGDLVQVFLGTDKPEGYAVGGIFLKRNSLAPIPFIDTPNERDIPMPGVLDMGTKYIFFTMRFISHTDCKIYAYDVNRDFTVVSNERLLLAKPGYDCQAYNLIKLPSGRIVIPVIYATDIIAGPIYLDVLYSDNNGDSFTLLNTPVTINGRGLMEPQPVLLSTGQVAIICRTQYGGNLSPAKVIYDPVANTLGQPEFMTGIAQNSSGSFAMNLTSGAIAYAWVSAIFEQRQNVVFAISTDDLQSWQSYHVVFNLDELGSSNGMLYQPRIFERIVNDVSILDITVNFGSYSSLLSYVKSSSTYLQNNVANALNQWTEISIDRPVNAENVALINIISSDSVVYYDNEAVATSNPFTLIAPDDFIDNSVNYADELALQTAFDLWLSGFSFTGGDNPIASFVGNTPPAICGGVATVHYVVTDAGDSDFITATFTITPPAVLVLTKPLDYMTQASMLADQAAADALFSVWLSEFGVTGGYAPTGSYGTVTCPPYTGGFIEVTYTATDRCEIATTKASFFIDADSNIYVHANGVTHTLPLTIATGNETNELLIRKGGAIQKLTLVEVSDTTASPIKVRVNGAIKAIRKSIPLLVAVSKLTTDPVIYRSYDLGATWLETPIVDQTNEVRSISISKVPRNVILSGFGDVGINAPVLWLSKDEGASFVPCAKEVSRVDYNNINPDGTKLFTVSRTKLYASRDEGATYQESGAFTYAIKVVTNFDGTKVVISEASVAPRLGTFNGTTFNFVYKTKPFTGGNYFVCASANFEKIYLSSAGQTEARIAMSTDILETYSKNTLIYTHTANCTVFCACSQDGRYILALVHLGTTAKVFVSNDFADTFTEVAITANVTGVVGTNVSASGKYMVVPHRNQNGKVYLSTDYGVTWNLITVPVAALISGVAVQD